LGWLQEVTSAFFIYGTTGAASRRGAMIIYISARRSDARPDSDLSSKLVRIVTSVALCLIFISHKLPRFEGSRMPSMTPIASLYVAIPSRVLIALLTVGSSSLAKRVRAPAPN
jgi:hypothetical protein